MCSLRCTEAWHLHIHIMLWNIQCCRFQRSESVGVCAFKLELDAVNTYVLDPKLAFCVYTSFELEFVAVNSPVLDSK